MNFSADRTGTTLGRNWQFSGDGFSKQQFTVNVVPASDFAAWASTGQKAASSFDQTSYAQLAAQGAKPSSSAPMKLGDPHIFHIVMMRYHQGKAVPPKSQPGTDSYVPAVAR